MSIQTYDIMGGAYWDDRGGGLLGKRLAEDRRYWAAWASLVDDTKDIMRGVMDDFGTLVPVGE